MSVGALLAPGKQDLFDLPPVHDKRGQVTHHHPHGAKTATPLIL